MRAKEPMIPLSILTQTLESHRAEREALLIAFNKQQEKLLESVTHVLGLHLEEANDRLGRHLADVAESYRKALEPPPLPDVDALFQRSEAARGGAPQHVSDEEAELRFQQEQGMIDATALQEALKGMGIPVEIAQ